MAGGLGVAYERAVWAAAVLVDGAASDSHMWHRSLPVWPTSSRLWHGTSRGWPVLRRAGGLEWQATPTRSQRSSKRSGSGQLMSPAVLGWHGGARALPLLSEAGCDPDHDRHLRGLEGIAARGRGGSASCGARQMLAAPQEHFDPTLPGLFAADPPPEFVHR